METKTIYTNQILKIMTKKHLTADDLGRLMILQDLHNADRASRCEGFDAVITQKQFQDLVDASINTKQDLKTFDRWRGLADWLRFYWSRSHGFLISAQARCNEISELFAFIGALEELQARRPVVLTMQTVKQYLQGVKVNGFAALFEWLRKLYHENKIDLSKYQRPIKDAQLLNNWNFYRRRGFYTLQDGRRSDEMTDDEWRDAVTTEKFKQAEALGLPVYHGDILSKQKPSNVRAVAVNYRKKLVQDGFYRETTWQPYDEPPTLKQCDIIGELDKIYWIVSCSNDDSDEQRQKQLQRFINDFDNVIADFADVIDVNKNYDAFDLFERGLPMSEWLPADTCATIAIVNRDGNYEQKQFDALFENFGLLQFRDDTHKANTLKTIDILKHDLRWLYAFNAILGLIEKETKLQGFDVLRAEFKPIEFTLVKWQYGARHLQSLWLRDTELDREKLKIIDEVFAGVDCRDLQPTVSAVETARREMRQLKCFDDALSSNLMTIFVGADGDR